MSLITQGGYYIWQIVNGSNTYTSENICGGTLNEGVYSECSIGNVTARQLNLKLWNVDIDPYEPIVLSYKESTSNTWVAKGTYLIDSVSTSPYSEYTEVTAFDAILKSEVVYMKEGTWTSTTASALVSEIATTMGISVESATAAYLTANNITIDQAPSIGANGTTCRQILQTIGALLGGNFTTNDANDLIFRPLFGRLSTKSSSPGYNINYYPTNYVTVGNEVVTFDKSDAEPIVGIEFQANGGESFRYPSGLTDAQWEALEGRILYCNLPFMASQDAVDRVGAIYVASTGAAYGIDYIPYTANTAYFSPDIVIGRGLLIKDTVVDLSNRTLNIDALASSDLSAETSRQAESFYPYVSPQVREARQKADENYAAISVNTESITAEVRRATTEEGNLSSEMTSVRQTAEEFSVWHTTSAQTEMDEAAQAAVDDYANTVEAYMRYSSGTLELGQTGSNFKAKLSNTRLAFTGADGQDAAWITNNQLNINEAVIQNDIQLPAKSGTGKWVQQVASNNHFQIRWIG